MPSGKYCAISLLGYTPTCIFSCQDRYYTDHSIFFPLQLPEGPCSLLVHSEQKPPPIVTFKLVKCAEASPFEEASEQVHDLCFIIHV
jgi:hypothetical protein